MAGGADYILLPELPVDVNNICMEMLRGQQAGKGHILIIKAEGVELSTDELVATLEKVTSIETRAVVLGYIQRGGSPTECDRVLASLTGAKAAQLLYNDSESRAVGIVGGEIVSFDLEEALTMKRPFNQEMYDLAVMLS